MNHENVEKIASYFVERFINLDGLNQEEEKYSFIEVLVGYVYAYKKVMKSVGALNIISPEELNKINEVLEKVAESNININLRKEGSDGKETGK